MPIAALVMMIFQLAPHVVLGIQTIEGDIKSGTDKKKMAQDALGVATQAALGVTTGDNQVLAKTAAAVASVAIDLAVKNTKASGEYQAATPAKPAA